jgi:hypothetical protein
MERQMNINEKQTYWQMDRQTNGQTNGPICTKTDEQRDGQIDGQTNDKTDGLIDRRIDGQMSRLMGIHMNI